MMLAPHLLCRRCRRYAAWGVQNGAL